MSLFVVYVTEILAIHIRFLAEGMSHETSLHRGNAPLKPRVRKVTKGARGALSKSWIQF